MLSLRGTTLTHWHIGARGVLMLLKRTLRFVTRPPVMRTAGYCHRKGAQWTPLTYLTS